MQEYPVSEIISCYPTPSNGLYIENDSQIANIPGLSLDHIDYQWADKSWVPWWERSTDSCPVPMTFNQLQLNAN